MEGKTIILDRDLKDILIMALRYALGRKTYVTAEVSDYIMNHPEFLDERVISVMLRDLSNYLDNRDKNLIHDDDCDYQNWLKLQLFLMNSNMNIK